MPRKAEKHDATSFIVSPSRARKRTISSARPTLASTGETATPGSTTASSLSMNTVPVIHTSALHSTSATPLQANTKAFVPELFNLQSLLEEGLAEPDWVIPGLLPTGVSLLAGPPQVDKSLLAHQLGLSVASGLPFLARFPVCQGRVLYLALAETFQQVRGRTLRLLRNQEYPASFTVALKWSPFRACGLADLEDTIITLGDARVIIVDPLEFLVPLPAAPGQRAHQSGSPAREPGFFLPLRELAARYHLAILLLHHLPEDWPVNRADLLAGVSPTGLTPASACNLLLMPVPGSGKSTLHIAGAQVEEQRLELRLDGEWRRAE